MEAEAALKPPGLYWRQICFGVHPTKTLVRVGIWVIVTTFFFHGLMLPIQIVGSSMAPTYQSGSMNLINKVSYLRHEPQRGDIIALSTTDELLLKRIVALPGETVQINKGVLEVNGKPVHDRFSNEFIPFTTDPWVLSKVEYFVIGDNRKISVFGPISRDQIVGKVVF
jgi:signal peptidase I